MIFNGSIAKFKDSTTSKITVNIRLEHHKQNKLDIDLLEHTEYDSISFMGSLSYGLGDRAGGQVNDLLEDAFYNGRLIFPYIPESRVEMIIKMWGRWHGNDMNEACRQQKEFLSKIKYPGYEKACELLKEAGIYEVKNNGRSYKYGSSWLLEPLTEEVYDFMEDMEHYK